MSSCKDNSKIFTRSQVSNCAPDKDKSRAVTAPDISLFKRCDLKNTGYISQALFADVVIRNAYIDIHHVG